MPGREYVRGLMSSVAPKPLGTGQHVPIQFGKWRGTGVHRTQVSGNEGKPVDQVSRYRLN